MATSDRERMLALRIQLIEEHPELETASDLAPLMGDLEQEYWRWQLENYFAKELGEK